MLILIHTLAEMCKNSTLVSLLHCIKYWHWAFCKLQLEEKQELFTTEIGLKTTLSASSQSEIYSYLHNLLENMVFLKFPETMERFVFPLKISAERS